MKRLAASMLLVPALAALAADSPDGWEFLRINDRKKRTAYESVVEDGRAVVHARAEASASGLYRKAGFALAETPLAGWSWKVSRLIEKADNAKGSAEDSPVRLLLAFEGDRSKLPASDQAVLRVAKRLSGQQLPYATLMYIWSKDAPVGTIIPNPHTRRIQMVVASSGSAGVGAWQKLSRDVAEDYRRAFKEEPGRLLAYGVMSDTDNTGESVEAWYGEIAFAAKP